MKYLEQLKEQKAQKLETQRQLKIEKEEKELKIEENKRRMEQIKWRREVYYK